MSKLEKRGRLIYLAVAAVLSFWILNGVGQALLGDWNQIKWWSSAIVPVGFLAALIGLWTGNQNLHWAVVAVCVVRGMMCFIGGIRAIGAFRQAGLSKDSEPEHLLYGMAGFVVLMGIAYLACAALLSIPPSVRAFFAFQRGERFGAAAQARKHPNLWSD